jgi:hypothetical protein
LVGENTIYTADDFVSVVVDFTAPDGVIYQTGIFEGGKSVKLKQVPK